MMDSIGSPRQRHNYCSVSAQVHKAIRDGEFAWLPDLIPQTTEEASSILWERNSSGWSAVHYAASHFLPREWWGWILVRAVVDASTAANGTMPSSQTQARRNKFVSVRNDLGENVFDIFFRSFLAPLPWQSTNVKNCSKLLCQAIQKICQEKGDNLLLQQVRSELQNENSLHATQHEFVWSSDGAGKSSAATGIITVDRCVVFCRNLQLLCQASHETMRVNAGNGNQEKDAKEAGSFPFPYVLSFLARNTGGCPEPVARLLLRLYPDQARTPLMCNPPNAATCSPPTYLLHIWSAYNQPTYRSLQGMLTPLIQAYPEVARICEEETGRYPLHHAMCSGNKSWHCLKPLFEAAPFVLQCIDPVTGFYPACLMAMAAQHVNDPLSVEIRARQNSAGDKGLVSLWYIMPVGSRKEAMQRAAKELECEALESIYLALRAFPRALMKS